MSVTINPYTVPLSQQGWRGLTALDRPRRKIFTLLHNEQMLVTALLQIPGEPGIRHSHESGELSIHYQNTFQPIVTWHGHGELHGGTAPMREDAFQKATETLSQLQTSLANSTSETRELLELVSQMQQEVEELQEGVNRLRGPEPTPRLFIDILFPPFRTTIDDPAYPGVVTITGQWFD